MGVQALFSGKKDLPSFHTAVKSTEKFWLVLIPGLAASLEIAGVFPPDCSGKKMPTRASKSGCS